MGIFAEPITPSTTTATGPTPAAKTRHGMIATGMALAAPMTLTVVKQTTRKATSLATRQAMLMV